MTVKSLNFQAGSSAKSHYKKLDTYQKLVVNAITTYGGGSWKNNVSVHHKHDQSQFSNILIGSEVVAKVVYETAHDDLSIEDYRDIHIHKCMLANVSYIAFGKDTDDYRDSYQVVRYRNMLAKMGFTIINVANKCIQY
tara:strand:- start:29771 stop:30184 length:414 start_codon:yes stop_codon:yes gene_type:complete